MLPPIIDTDEQSIANKIVSLANIVIANKKNFHIVLAGGETPRSVYCLLRDAKTDWHQWHVYFGDERCAPPHNSSRNDTMAFASWLGHVDIPARQIHCIPAELKTESCIEQYSQTLAAVGQFDLVLLGIGDDGHTASLFPGNNHGESMNEPAVLAVNNAPKPPMNRISLSAWRLSSSTNVWFLIKGDSKQTALQQWQAGENLPASVIRAKNELLIYRIAAT